MLTCLQYHLGCPKDRLGCKFISLLSWHAVGNCSIRHCLDKHIDIGRGRSAHANNGIHHSLRHDLCLAKTFKDCHDFLQFFRADLFIRCHGTHCLAHQCRCVWHRTHQFDLPSKQICNGRQCLSGCDRYDHLTFFTDIPDLWDHRGKYPRLYGKE